MKAKIIMGALCFCTGILLATGIDHNPQQAWWALLLIGVAALCLKDKKA